MRPHPLDPARDGFRRRFGRVHDALAYAPGRVNLIGEHVDYAEGLVLPMAIERGTAVAASRSSAGGSTRLHSTWGGSREIDLEAWIEAAASTPPAPHWSNYPLGAIALLRETGLDVPPLDLTIDSTLPIGGGLSSSASLTVATALVALAIAGIDAERFGRLPLAALCRAVEHRFAGVPCGPMDPAIVACGREGHAMLLDCLDGSTRQWPLPARASIVVFDSMVRHRLDEGGYAARQRDVRLAADALGVPSLRALLDQHDRSLERALDRLAGARLPGHATRRARHVVSEIDRVRRFTASLDPVHGERADASTRLVSMGRILVESHASLRDDFEVSTPELDALATDAVEAGAYGARLTGAGFGGCAIALCASDRADAIGDRVARRFADRFGSPCSWFITGAARGATICQ